METVRTEILQAQGWEKWLSRIDSLSGSYSLESGWIIDSLSPCKNVQNLGDFWLTAES